MEALERKGRVLAIVAIILIVFWSQCQVVEGADTAKMSYVCPPQFIRLGHSCYFFSENKATWQNALFACKDKESNLSVPARWEDRNLRNYLNSPGIEKASRWIGGIYDYSSKKWRWGGELKEMRYQSFSKMKKFTPEELKWHCIAMMPELLYRWAPRSCIEPRQYICQTRILKVSKSEVKEYRKKWQRMGIMNEITAPSLSGENFPNANTNDVTIDPFTNPKSFDLGPSQLNLQKDDPNVVSPGTKKQWKPSPKKRSRGPRPTFSRKLKKPFPGYRWNRRNPKASFEYNAKILRSGRTGLRPQQVNTQLARLRHMRDRQMRRLEKEDWLVNEPMPNILAQTNARTYTVDTNISALHPKTIVEEFDFQVLQPPQVALSRVDRGTQNEKD